MLSEAARRKLPWVLLGIFFLAVFIDFLCWWASLDYAAYANVCEPTSNNQDCDSYYFLVAFAVSSAYKLNYWGALITAVSTGFIALFTWTLWRATEATSDLAEKQFLLEGQQADLAAKQHGLARLQHIAANKPKLRIRSISLRPPVPGGTMIRSGYKMSGHLVIANSGATDAKILGSGYRFFWSSAGLPMQPPLDGPEVQILYVPNDTLAAYGSCSINIESHTTIGPEADALGLGVLTETKVYLMGFVRYADINGAERYMGFCRRYVPPKQPFVTAVIPEGRFIPEDNGDYEYED